MNNDTLKIEDRKILYYKKYQYKAKFNLLGAHQVGYAKNQNELDKIISNHIKWATAPIHILNNKAKLEKLLYWKINNQDSICIRTEYGNCSIFSNDLNLLRTLNDFVDDVSYTTVELHGDPEVIELLNPKHNYRVYLKSKGIRGTSFLKDISDLLELHKNTFFPCKALRTWIDDERHQPAWKYNWISNSHYIEYDDESAKVLLNLFLDGYLAKTYKVKMRNS